MNLSFEIDFEPLGKRVACPQGKSVLDCARSAAIGISCVCGGNGTCHSCKVQVLDGPVSDPTAAETAFFSARQLDEGWRLACQVSPGGDCKLLLPPESMTTSQRTQVQGVEVTVAPETVVRDCYLQLEPAAGAGSPADAERVIRAVQTKGSIPCETVDIDVLRGLSPRLRAENGKVGIVLHRREIISVETGEAPLTGLAVDLGSTKIAAYLVDLKTGKTLAAGGIINPQVSYGEDIISRIVYAFRSPADARRLQDLVIEAINGLAADLCHRAGTEAGTIADVVVVGNTAMHHLALGLPVTQLAQAPFVPAVTGALNIKAREVGLRVAPGAYLHLLPNISAFVGADHVAMLLATRSDWATGIVLALDIGTNTEVSLIREGRITAASCASGPAFEGGHIKDGMRAAAGAIEKVRLEDGTVKFETIDGAPPTGICGSGLLDAVAQMYLAGVLDRGGRMTDNHPRVRLRREEREFVLVTEEERQGGEAIVLTQKDVRELQYAKAAIHAGIRMLLEGNQVSEDRIDRVIIAGAFGSYIDIGSAVTIGMLPDLPVERFKQVGNAAGAGARLALVSQTERARAATIASSTRYLELAGAPGFSEAFTEATFLGARN